MRRRSILAALALAFRAAGAQPAPPPNATTWTFIGPTKGLPRPVDPRRETSGRVRAIAIDPSRTFYVAASGGGVWKRAGGGRTWTPLTDFAPTLDARSIAIDPSNPGTIYVGTGSVASQQDYHGSGILKSTDGGMTWTHIVGPFLDDLTNRENSQLGTNDGGARIIAIAVSPTDPNVVLASVVRGVDGSATSGVYRSSDGGLQWTPVRTGNYAHSLFFHPTDGNVAYAAFGSNFVGTIAGVYQSVDAGRSWGPLNGTGTGTTLPAAGVGKISLAIAPSRPATMYVGISDGVGFANLLGLYKTIDGGATWRLASAPNYCASQCSAWNQVAVHPTDPDVVLVGGSGHPVYRSLDGGVTWGTEISGIAPAILHADVWAIVFPPDGNSVFVGTDGGIDSTAAFRDATVAWAPLNENLGITNLYPGFDVDSARRDFVMVGSQDNDVHNFRGDLQWPRLGIGEGPHVAYDGGADRAHRWAGHGVWNPAGYYDLVPSSTGLAFSEPRGDIGAPIAINRNNAAIQYTGTNRVYQTVDGRASWVAISPASPVLSRTPQGYVTSIAIAGHQPNMVCAGTSDGNVWCTADANRGAASTWVNRSPPGTLPRRYVSQVSIHKFKEYIIAVAYSGYRGVPGVSGDVGGHVYLSEDSGVSWRDVTGNLPNAPVNGIIFDEYDNDEPMYVATDAGVFRTRDRGASWARVATGLPNAIAVGLHLHYASRTLYAATVGRSMWRLTVPILDAAPPPAIAMNPWRMRFSALAGGTSPAPQSLSVINPPSVLWGASSLGWTATASTAFGGAWLSATPAAGTGDATVLVSVNVAGLAAGRYNGVVRLAGTGTTNGPQDLLVMLEVTAPPRAMSAEEMLGALIESAGLAGLIQPAELLMRGRERWKQGYLAAACNAVRAFQRQLESQTDKKLTAAQAATLASDAKKTFDAMRCQS